MRLRLWVILFAIAALTAFVILNWPVFIAPTPLSLGFASYEAPLGVVMLALVGLHWSFILYIPFNVRLYAQRINVDGWCSIH